VLGEPREEDIPPLVADRFRHVSQQPLTIPAGSRWYSFKNSTTSRHRTSKSGSSAMKAASRAMLIGW
jgi:hypothetical protein